MKIKLHSTKNLIIFFICAGMAAYDIVAAWGTRDWFWLAVGVFFAFVAVISLIAAFSKKASDHIEQRLQEDRDR